jgi:hypothetical protein
MPLIFVTVGCASPLDNQLPIADDSVAPEELLEPSSQSPDLAQPQPPPAPEPQPPATARGAPLDIAIFTIEDAPYSLNQEFVEDEIIKACGGTLCVNIHVVFAPAGPESLTCNVAAIDQPEQIFPGDTITFSLSDECDEGEPDGEGTEDENNNESENEDVAPETATTTTEEPTP